MLLWSSVASVAVTVLAGCALIAFPLAGIVLVALELTGRRQAWLRWLTVASLGFVLGFGLVISESDSASAGLAIVVIAVLAVVLVRARQRGLAGGLAIAAAAPWLASGGAVLLDVAMGAPDIAPGPATGPFIAAVAGLAIGIKLLRDGRSATRDASARGSAPGDPALAPATDPIRWVGGPAPDRPWDAASRAAFGPTIGGLNAATVATMAVLVVGPMVVAGVIHGRPLVEAIVIGALGAGLTALLATIAWAVVWPPRNRRAFEAFAWLGETDLARFRALTGGRLEATLPNMRRYVADTPETPGDRWIRVEALASAGELEAARAIADRLPVDTPDERIEKLTYGPYLDWLGGGSGDHAALRAAVAAIEPADGDARLRGEVSVALAEVRQRVAAGDPDPAAPLRDVRERIGARANGILFAPARRILPSHLRLAGLLTLALAALDRLGGG